LDTYEWSRRKLKGRKLCINISKNVLAAIRARSRMRST